MNQPSAPRHLLPLALLLLAGCATSPAPRLYVPSPGPGWSDAARRDALQSPRAIRLAPVRLPAYLDRPQIVTRLSPNEIKVDPFNRWGMPLDVLAAEILAGSLALALPDAYVDVSPSRTLPPAAHYVQVEILRLDGPLGGPLELVAQWTVDPADPKAPPVARQIGRQLAPAAAPTYEAYVDAIRQTLADLGAQIAAAIPSTPPAP